MKSPRIVIRMGAPFWDATVHEANGKMAYFDFRTMTDSQRKDFFRILRTSFHKKQAA